MKITQIHTNKPQSLSFEIFPPKKEEDFKNIDEMLEILCDCHPEYISVTFGAGGSSNNNKTIEIAKKIKNQYNVEPVVRPIAISVVSNAKPKVRTSIRYTSRKSPPPSFAARYGNLHIFPSPTALPAAARTNPMLPEKVLLDFSFILYCLLNILYNLILI